jgi:hypothetical protein
MMFPKGSFFGATDKLEESPELYQGDIVTAEEGTVVLMIPNKVIGTGTIQY